MNDALRMKVSEAFASLPITCRQKTLLLFRTCTHFKRDTSDLIFLELIVLNDIRKCTTFHVLHDDPEFVAFDEIRLQEVDDVGMLRFLHDENFVDNEFFAWLVGQVHLLDGNLLARRKRLGYIHMPRRTTNTKRISGYCIEERKPEKA